MNNKTRTIVTIALYIVVPLMLQCILSLHDTSLPRWQGNILAVACLIVPGITFKLCKAIYWRHYWRVHADSACCVGIEYSVLLKLTDSEWDMVHGLTSKEIDELCAFDNYEEVSGYLASKQN